MSIQSEAQKEFVKLKKQIDTDNKKLRALQCVMQEYAVAQYPGNATINHLVDDCMAHYKGEATFKQIRKYISERHVVVPATKLSLALTKHEDLEYAKEKKMWVRRSPLPDQISSATSNARRQSSL